MGTSRGTASASIYLKCYFKYILIHDKFQHNARERERAQAQCSHVVRIALPKRVGECLHSPKPYPYARARAIQCTRVRDSKIRLGAKRAVHGSIEFVRPVIIVAMMRLWNRKTFPVCVT